MEWELRRGDDVARISSVGATLLGYRRGTTWLTEPTAAGQAPAAGNGQLLVPWPNRVRDGRWTLDGIAQQLAITDATHQNASHGLLRKNEYEVRAESAHRVELQAVAGPAPGYPFTVVHRVDWALGPEGLTCTHHLTHEIEQDARDPQRTAEGPEGSQPAPVAIGAHPYLRVGDVPVPECTLQVEADQVLVVDDRLIPVGVEDVSGATDWRTPREIGTAPADRCWLVSRGAERHRLRAPDGRGVDLRFDEAFGHVQLFLTDRLPGRDHALAVEPMTAPADAFNSGTGLVWLAPGESFTASWSIEPVGF